MIKASQHAGVEGKYINIIREIYKLSRDYIALEENGRIFQQSTETKQDNSFSSALFNTALEFTLRKLNWRTK